MEILVNIILVTLLGALLLSPIFLLRYLNRTNSKYKFLIYLTIGVFLTAFIVFVFAWWGHTSNKLLLTHYGYNFEGWSDKEHYAQVAPENLERVKTLMTSRMGIGWPVKAMMAFAIYFPYVLIVYIVGYLIDKNRSSKKKSYSTST